jgi:endo-1,3-1,4-beta-glycanase ExoK
MVRCLLAGIFICISGSALARDDDDAGPAAMTGAAVSSPAATPAPSFVERFRGPDLDARWYVSQHDVTGEWSAAVWRRSQVATGPQGMVITLAPAEEGLPKPYVSGELMTREFYRYGYFEARMQIPRGSGLVAAFFTFSRRDGQESWNEIDMEFTPRDPRRIELVYHVAGDATLQVLELPFDASAGLHTYGFEWRPDEIRWYIDNRLVHISRGGRVAELTQPQQMFASLWNSVRMPRWLGPLDPAEAPWRMVVSCMAYAPTYEGRSLCAST